MITNNGSLSQRQLTHQSVMPSSLLFSQLSLRTNNMGAKVIFKIGFNNEWKRIPQEKEIIYEDILRRSLKGFNLDYAPGSYVLVHESGPMAISSQELLNQFLSTELTQSKNVIKFVLTLRGSSSIETTLSSLETG
jgi:hypothetical protein